MKVRLDVIQEQLRTAAARLVPEDEAAYFAELMLEAHLKKAPRMIRSRMPSPIWRYGRRARTVRPRSSSVGPARTGWPRWASVILRG